MSLPLAISLRYAKMLKPAEVYTDLKWHIVDVSPIHGLNNASARSFRYNIDGSGDFIVAKVGDRLTVLVERIHSRFDR